MGWRDAPVVASGATPKWKAAPVVAPAAPAEGPGVVEAALRAGGQGFTVGFGDELAAAFGAAIGNDNAPTLGQRYTNLRDSFRRENKAAREAHPVVSTAAEMVGGLPLAIATGGQARNASLGAKVATGAGTGALFGGLSAAGASEGDPNQTGADAGGGATTGALIGAALPLVGRTVALPLAQKLRDVGNNAGRRVLTRMSSSLSSKKPVSDAAVEAAREAGAFGPLKDTKYANEVLDQARESVGDLYGQIVAELEAKGVRGPQAQALAAQLSQEAKAISGQTLGSPRPGVFQGIADELPTKPTDAAGTLGLTQAENMKRELQHIARNEYDKLNAMQTPKGEANEAVASRVRQAIEDAVDKQTRPDAFARAASLRAKMQELAANPPAPQRWTIGGDSNKELLLSMDPSKPGRWRVTRFEGGSPMGHVEAPDYAAALDAAKHSGADILPPLGELRALGDSFQPVKEKLGLLIQASNAARAGVNRSQKNAAISLPDIVAGSGPHGPLGGVAMHLMRTRGPSTMAWGAGGVSDLLRALADPSTDKKLLAEMLRRATLPIAAEQAGGIQ